jgi:hypothetical protein
MIYVVQQESGEYDEYTKEVIWVGTTLIKALEAAMNGAQVGTICFSVWNRNKMISEYFQDSWVELEEQKHSTWERNSGKILDYMEVPG